MSACAESTLDCAALGTTTWPSLLSHRVWAAVTVPNFSPGWALGTVGGGGGGGINALRIIHMRVHQHLLHPLLFFTQETHKNVGLVYFDKKSSLSGVHWEEKPVWLVIAGEETKKRPVLPWDFLQLIREKFQLKTTQARAVQGVCIFTHVRHHTFVNFKSANLELGIASFYKCPHKSRSLLDSDDVWPMVFMSTRGLAVQQCGGPWPDPFMQSRQSRGRPSNTKCLINLIICLWPQGMKSLFARHLRPRVASAKLLTHICTRCSATHYLAYFSALLRIKSHPWLPR